MITASKRTINNGQTMINFFKVYCNYIIDKTKEIRNDFAKFSPSEKAYIIGQCLWLFVVVIAMTLTPIIIKIITGDTALTGVARAVYLWTIAATTLGAGEIVKSVPIRRVLIGTNLIRALLYGVVGVLLFAQQLSFSIFIIILAMVAFVVAHSHLIDLDMGGANKIFTSAKKKERALYLFLLINYFSLLVLPILVGLIIDFLEEYLAEGIGIGFVFLLLCMAMLMGSYVYYKYLKLPEEQIVTKGLSLSRLFPFAQRFHFGMTHSLWNAAKIVWANDALSLRFAMVAAEQFIDDALLMVVLPTFALDILNSGITGNALLLSSMNMGGLLAAVLLLSNAQYLQKVFGFYRFLFWLAIGASLAFIPTITFWVWPSLWVAIPAVIAMKFLYEPIRGRMDAMLQAEIQMDEKAKPAETNIYSLLTLIDTSFAGLGALTFTWLFLNSVPGTLLHQILGANAPMKAVTLVLMVFSVINVLGLIWIKKYIYHVYYPPAGVVDNLYKDLQANIMKMELSPFQIDYIHAPHSSSALTIALFAPPTLDMLAIAQEGGRQSPGNIHLVFDPSWIVQELQPDSTYSLYLKKGLYFDREGDIVIAEYKVLRPIYYFVNFSTPGTRTPINGVPFESKLNIPMSSSSKLEHLIKEKFLTRVWLAENGILVPITRAFLMPAHPFLQQLCQENEENSEALVTPFPSLADPHHRIELLTQVREFLNKFQGEALVVKPSGARFSPQYGVKFFDKHQVEEIVDHLITLAKDPLMTPQGSLLIEEKIESLPLYIRIGEEDGSGRYCFLNEQKPLHILDREEISMAAETEKKDWVFHILVARSPWNKGVTAGILARMGNWGKPLTLEAAVVPFEDIVAALRQQYGLLISEEEAWQFQQEMDLLANKILMIISKKEKEYPHGPEDPPKAETDFLGIDVMINRERDQLKPKVIAVNDHNIGKQFIFDKIYPERSGEHSRIWVATMLSKARQTFFKGKKLILVGAGYSAKKFYFDRAQELDVEVILIDKPNSWARDLVSEYIPIEGSNNKEDLFSAYHGIQRYIHSKGPIDGITTFWEDDIVLTAQLARDLNLPFYNVESARTTRSKAKTRKILKAAALPVPLFYLIQNQHVLDKALGDIMRIQHVRGVSPFPMILKPVFGAASQFTVKVFNAEETRAIYKQISREVALSDNSIFKQGTDFILEEYIEGKEWDVDLVVQGGKVKYHSITDNWCFTESEFLPTCDSLPSYRLTPEAQQASVKLAIQAVEVIGITDGVLHIEGKHDPVKGPQILEVNGRPGGAYLVPWQMGVWGVDLAEMLFATALKIPAHIYKAEMPLTYFEGECLIASESGVFLGWEGAEELPQCPGFKEFSSFINPGDLVLAPPEGSDYIAYLVAEGKDSKTALENFKRMRSMIKFRIQPKNG